MGGQVGTLLLMLMVKPAGRTWREAVRPRTRAKDMADGPKSMWGAGRGEVDPRLG